MPSIQTRIDVSVDTGDLDQRVGSQVAQLQQVIQLVAQLIDNPPTDVGDLLELATNLPLPEFELDTDFTSALNAIRGSLPADAGDLTSVIDGDLSGFVSLIDQLNEVLQSSVKIAAALEKLTSMDFTCPGDGSNSGTPTPPSPAGNPGADRMQRTAEQTQQVNDLLDKLPASPTVDTLISTALPELEKQSQEKVTAIALPVFDDIVFPLRTLNRWKEMNAADVGVEIKATIAQLNVRLLGATRAPLDALIADLSTLNTQLGMPALTAFGNSYEDALEDLVEALELDELSSTVDPVIDMNQALDDVAATFSAWDAGVASDLKALCKRVHGLDDSLLDRISHLLTVLEPVELPKQFISTIPAPRAATPQQLEAVQATIQPVIDWLTGMVDLLDFSSIEGEIETVATEAQQIADAVEQGLTGVAVQVQSLFDDIISQLGVVDLNALRDQLIAQIEQYTAFVERQIGNAFTPASAAITEATTALSDALDNFDPEDVIDALRSVIQAITAVFESGEIADMIDEVRNAIETVTQTLEQLSFTPVTNEVVSLIEQMADALRKLQSTDLNDAANAALSAALSVLPEDLKPVTDPLIEEFDQLIDNGPVPLLERIAEKPAELLSAIRNFQPSSLIGDALTAPYRQALDKAESFRPGQLFDLLNSELEKGKQTLIKQASPGKALASLSGPFDSLKSELNRYSPDTLLQPVEQKIEDVIAQIIDASPVDEIFEQVDRVFALIEQALEVPKNVVGTLERLDTLFAHLSNPNQQIDSWRDGLLDKVFDVTNISDIADELGNLNNTLSSISHSQITGHWNTQTQGLLDVLQNFDPGGRIHLLVSLHNRARAMVSELPDSAEVSAIVAVLNRFEPGRTSSFILLQKLQQCLEDSRTALAGMATEWQDLVESPDSLLSEYATISANADGLRTLVASAIEPLLIPVRYLFSQIEAAHPAVQALLSTLSELVDDLTSGVEALITGPGSLQTISDAIQSVVDTLRNIDLGFLRESLQKLFIELLDQINALNPAQFKSVLDNAFRDLLDALSLENVISPGSVESLDASYQSVLDKLRALDPETLVTEVVQPEYESTIVPIVEAFDLTPVFNALIEFLRGLGEELGGELDRVNTAYQSLRTARSGSASASVNVNVAI